jgi:hypothetical protein
MPGMNGVDLIKWTQAFMKSKNVSEDDMPHFAFRGQQFWDLPPEKVREIFELGVKSRDIIEKVINKQQVESYFKQIGYYYRQLADD